MKRLPLLICSALLALGSLGPAMAAEPKPIQFGDITWESGSFTTQILRFIVEKGYGYRTDTLPGSTVSMEVALARNDIQVIAEEWAGRSLFNWMIRMLMCLPAWGLRFSRTMRVTRKT